MKYLKIIVIILFHSLTNCESNNHKEANNHSNTEQMQGKVDFKNLIDSINVKVVDLTAPSDLFSIDEFIVLYENPSRYKDDALLLISDIVNNTQKKQIAVFALQNLLDSEYIDLCSSVVDLYVKNIVKEELLQTTVFYSLNSKYIIFKNYKNAVVIGLLNKIKAHSQSDDLKRRVDDILSGKALDKLS